MTTGTSSPPPLPSSTPANRLVDERLARIGNTVKVSDIGSGLMLWLAGLFSLVMLWVLIDHWIVGLPIWGRFVGLISLLTWTAYSWVRWVVPHIFRRINPAYAAQVVERADPHSRNRLLNFVLLRGDRRRLREPVYRELEEQANLHVRDVDADEAVDRSGLIRVSMVAAGLFVLFGLYTAVSPKSPLATLARLLAPWKTIARPAKVYIHDVRPGSTTVYAGQSLEVSAMADRVSDDDSVWLVYSSVDQQIVNQRVLMKRDKSSGRYAATLPKPPSVTKLGGNSTARLSSTRNGIRAHLDYRIEVSDAVAGPFRVTVSPKPSLVVERVEYDFPDYTNLPSETVDGLGDIKALEGTRVRIFATANQPIDSAYLELDPGDGSAARRTVRMQHDGLNANVSFRLRLEQDRQTQLHRSYQLRFTNAEHEINDRPILHQIDIDPDLPPIVEILQPETRVTDVPLNGAQLLEIRGLDPDFGLAGMTLHGVARGRELFTPRSLLNETEAGQAVRRLMFRPQKFGLVEGDEVEVWASAFDNRFDVFEETAAPNMARNTPRYKLRVVAPVKQASDGSSDGSGEEERGGESAGEDGDGESGAGGTDGSGESSDPNSQQGEGSRKLEDQPGDEGSQSSGSDSTDGESGESGESGEQQSGGQSGESGESSQGSESGDGQNGDGQPGGESSQDSGDDGDGGMGESGGQSGSANRQPSESGDRSSDGQRGEQGDETGQAGESGNGETGSGGERNGRSNSDPSVNRRPQDLANYDPNEPVPSDGSSDGDAFERVLDRMRELNGERSDGTPKSNPNESDDPADADGAENNRNEDGSGESPSGGNGDDRHNNSESRDASTGNESQDSGESRQAGESQDKSQGSDDAPGEQPSQPGGHNSDAADENSQQPSGSNEDGMSNGDPSGESPQGSSGSQQSGQPGDANAGEGESPSGEAGQRGEVAEGGQPGESGNGGQSGGEDASSDGEGTGSGERAGDSGEGGAPGQGGSPGEGDGGNSESGESGESRTGDSTQGRPGEADGEPTEAGEDGGAEESGENRNPSESGAESGGSMPGGSDIGAEGSSADGNSAGGQAAGSPGGNPVGGGGQNPTGEEQNEDGPASESSSDAANLEYTKKATDLALEYLKDQRDKPDPELLDRLGWTERELQEFLSRWESLQKTARQPKRGEANPDDFHDALRSLGLHPGRDRLRRGGLEDDQVQGVHDGGVRSKPPAEYDSLYREFMRRRGKRSTTGPGTGAQK